jgi:hypothetical protein
MYTQSCNRTCDAVCSHVQAILQKDQAQAVPAPPGICRLLACLDCWCCCYCCDVKLGAAASDNIVRLLQHFSCEYCCSSWVSADAIAQLHGVNALLSLPQIDARAGSQQCTLCFLTLQSVAASSPKLWCKRATVECNMLAIEYMLVY